MVKSAQSFFFDVREVAIHNLIQLLMSRPEEFQVLVHTISARLIL
jgi:hypothetical protein